MCEGLMKTVFTKRWVPLEIRLVGGDRVAYWLQSCQWLLLSLLSSWSHHYGLYWCMPSKKERRFWCEVDAGYLPSGSNEMEVWRQWSGFLLLNCCVWVVILGLGSLGNRVGSLGSWGRNLTARETPLEQNGLTPMVSIVQIVLAKCRSARAASHQPAFMGSCLTISHMCMPGLPSKWISPCILKF